MAHAHTHPHVDPLGTRTHQPPPTTHHPTQHPTPTLASTLTSSAPTQLGHTEPYPERKLPSPPPPLRLLHQCTKTKTRGRQGHAAPQRHCCAQGGQCRGKRQPQLGPTDPTAPACQSRQSGRPNRTHNLARLTNPVQRIGQLRRRTGAHTRCGCTAERAKQISTGDRCTGAQECRSACEARSWVSTRNAACMTLNAW
jgi:hypothetical protein